MTKSGLVIKALLLSAATAAPFESPSGMSFSERQAPTVPRRLLGDEQGQYTKYAHYASAAYCTKRSLERKSCGIDCASNFEFFQYHSAGGDNSRTLPYYIGYDSRDLTFSGSTSETGGTVILSYQGATSGFIGRLVQVRPKTLTAGGPNLFKTVPPNVNVHSGFAELHALTAAEIQSSIAAALGKFNSSKIVVTGHSLGGALALIAAASLKQNFPGKTVSSVAFAAPRVGNSAFAAFAGEELAVIRHVNNKQDFVPVIPGRTAQDLRDSPLNQQVILRSAYENGNNYSGVKGEIHIDQSGAWYDCGNTLDNPSTLCSTGAVTYAGNAVIDPLVPALSLLFPIQSTGGALNQTDEATISAVPLSLLGLDHNGPYNDVAMGVNCPNI